MHNIPDEKTLRAAVALATRAPSIHNSQPWLWRLADAYPESTTLHLFADPSRLLPNTDSQGRDLLLSCGAVLHQLRVALAAEGWATKVHRLPNPALPNHLAAVEFSEYTANGRDIALARAITERRTDRRRFSSWPVPQEILDDLAIIAARQGAFLLSATDPFDRYHLVSAIAQAAVIQQDNSAYAEELAEWSGRSALATEGIPSSNIPVIEPKSKTLQYDDLTMRAFPSGVLTQPPAGGDFDAGELLVLATSDDDRMSWLKAGEAMSAVLLHATDFQLATCPLSQALEIGSTRELVRRRVLDRFGYPQIVIRVGWAPIENMPLPPTPRRPLAEVFDRLPDRTSS